jgi:hypothetical protein
MNHIQKHPPNLPTDQAEEFLSTLRTAPDTPATTWLFAILEHGERQHHARAATLGGRPPPITKQFPASGSVN